MDELRATKLWLQKQFNKSGCQLEPKALEKLINIVYEAPDPEEFVHEFIDVVDQGNSPTLFFEKSQALPDSFSLF
jgi:hypothetical protein